MRIVSKKIIGLQMSNARLMTLFLLVRSEMPLFTKCMVMWIHQVQQYSTKLNMNSTIKLMRVL
ncbi:hypothetical protein U876_07605 [Aeromonas hydrophila NJ-35]|nr:hypothetical protein AHML_14975 [Aeromonas hydrophila ML09-119]AHX33414.1 hypothetical protein V428_15480 [Aeromonas hydrophila subsp. hydrophila AL09-71]AHX70215.1 hypothetical protein V429_15510 [Aeromonas hydrophila pc104A]AJE35773.1 hypothetical protein V469_07635 [Aeromonas hydrophila J-1]AKJ33970.1 hypothetical protein U876_07605 [Aeromonas hydrophila NJ-35]ALQ62812.1 hypothetical protein AS145_07885 [Aeromonas hydrophila]